MTQRTPKQIEADLDRDIRETIEKIYGPINRQVRDSVAFVALALFLGTLAILAQILGTLP